MLPARNERHGGEAGPSYTTNASLEARNLARGWLEQHYQIVHKPLADVGWQLGGNPMER